MRRRTDERRKLARRSTPDTFRRAVELAESGQLKLGRLISRRVPLQDAIPAVARFVARDGMKGIIEPHRPPDQSSV